MAKAKQVRERNKQKKLERRRRRQKKGHSDPARQFREPTSKLADKIEEVYELIADECFFEAEQRIDQLVKRYPRYPAVFETQLYLYQELEEIEGCCAAAKQILKLVPRDPVARLVYAQTSMLSGRLGIAHENYDLFLEQWPEHPNASKARIALTLLKEECESNLEKMGFDEIGCKLVGVDPDMDEATRAERIATEMIGTEAIRMGLLRMHDQIVECMQRGNFADATGKCLQLLELVPKCMSARNNLALCLFHSGHVEKALKCAEETMSLAPSNRFAEASLGKLRFLCGDAAGANMIADRLVANPPNEPDPLGATSELLSLLGRDEDIVVLSAAVPLGKDSDSRFQAIFHHHLAVAQYRLGDPKAARRSWKACLRAMPTHLEAAANLDDLESDEGHAPWAEPLVKWIPSAVLEKFLDTHRSPMEEGQLNLLRDHPSIASLIPALLDRGDPQGRELAKSLACADGSPEMLDVLARFALGSRGPDAMRFKVLNLLHSKGHIDSGPHRIYRRCEWTDVKLCTAEITWAATSPLEDDPELAEAGAEALKRGDFALAEETFNRILELHPDSCSATHNLCVIWLKRDGEQGLRRARARLEELHQRFPSYRFANISLSQLAALDNDFERVGELLRPVLEAKRLHVSEARALFAVQVQIAVERREFEAAEQAFSMYIQVADEDDPAVTELRRRIDSARSARGFRRLVPWVGNK